MQQDDASKAQVRAARPTRSTWLSANAGSGKTRVLTDRVARLLLEEVNPQHVLCLTYTKAAASEMQNRLFKRLGEWAMLPDDALIEQLRTLGLEDTIPPEKIKKARRLFARAIETPGGLKIQTIHSFCSSLLRRFPMEAGVTPQFKEMDEQSAAMLRTEIAEQIANGKDAPLLNTVARQYSGESFRDLTAEIARRRSAFDAPLQEDALYKRFGIKPGLTVQNIADEVFLGSEQSLLAQLVPALIANGGNDKAAGEALGKISRFDITALPTLERVFLLKSGEGEGLAKVPDVTSRTFPTKGFRKNTSVAMDALDDLMLRVSAARGKRLALLAVEKTRTLHAFASIFLPAYANAKQARGWLDFDDLILRARDLLTDPQVAEWVLFRLDGGIDHILVDEAQDTSPVQWQVIERLAREFTSGEGARSNTARTIFVVGDKKQSIYSFQGADPREFDRMQEEFATRLSASGTPLNSMELEYSFRSSHAILALVDQTFTRAQQSGFAQDQSHKAFKADMPGRVDLWPVIPQSEKEEEPAWFTPVDVKTSNDPSVLLAKRIAGEIKALIDAKHPMPKAPEGGGPYLWRAVQPGDFLILVQRRSTLFHEMIRECKALDLPVAGADRLKVGAELAVRDLGALLSFLATPEDSLSLAEALKSPLFGWSEAELYTLAHHRKTKYLWPALRSQTEIYPETTRVLGDLLEKADFLRPFDLIERILTRHTGRHNLLSRLGPEAEDGIDALLSQAMAYEQNSVDSLTGFLLWMQEDDFEIKRQMDSAGNRIRVMTVHGAKGLEAPIVILPDTGKRKLEIKDQIIMGEDTALWRGAAVEATPPVTTATQTAKEAQRAERDRLLYVAMTRAENWLIVAAAGDLGKDGDTWYDAVSAGLDAAGAQPHIFPFGPGKRLSHRIWPDVRTEDDASDMQPAPDVPSYFCAAATPPPEPLQTLSPSQLPGAKALPGEAGLDEEAAKLRGNQIHKLLEVLPECPKENWTDVASYLLGEDADPTVLSEVAHLLSKPELAPYFAPNILREVPISVNLAALAGRRIHGIIDVLIVEDTRILAIDFKSNAIVPAVPQDCPDGLLRQMGAYAHALQVLYPDHKIDTAILWTKTANMMMLPHDLVTDALNTTQIS